MTNHIVLKNIAAHKTNHIVLKNLQFHKTNHIVLKNFASSARQRAHCNLESKPSLNFENFGHYLANVGFGGKDSCMRWIDWSGHNNAGH